MAEVIESPGAKYAQTGAEIIERIQERLRSSELDAVVAMAPENLAYCAGAVPPSLRTVRDRLAFALIPATGPAEGIVVALEGPLMESESWLPSIRTYVEFEQHPVDALAESMQGRGLADGKVAIELTCMSVVDHRRLAEALPKLEIVAGDSLLTELRVHKTPAEVSLIREIGTAAEAIAQECSRLAKPGMTERQLGNLISERYFESGGDDLTMLVVGSGPRSAHPNAPPTERRLEPGDLVRLDIIGTKRGYYSDVARTAVVGQPGDAEARIYRLLRDVHSRAIDALRPGASTRDIYRIYVDEMERANLPHYHFLGHGLGVTLHEEPFVDNRAETLLEEGMVLCIEPLTFVDAKFGIQIEDEIAITADGCEPITLAGDSLIEIGGS